MKIVYFTHSLLSCWNHGNAHFLRGVLRELQARGHNVLACEQQGNWSLANLLADHGQAGLAPFREHFLLHKRPPTTYIYQAYWWGARGLFGGWG